MRQWVIKYSPKLLMVCLVLVLIWLTLPACGDDQKEEQTPSPPPPMISLNSTSFQDNSSIPIKYTCSGQNVSPSLTWDSVSEGTQTFALIVVDPDANGFTHWVLFNVPSGVTELSEAGSPQGQLPAGALEGKNSFGKTGYGGPCPPSGKLHKYLFAIYALDQSLDLKTGASKDQVFKAMEGHILAIGQLIGTYQR